MDYRIEKTDKKRFITRVRAFDNETANDETGHSIPDFWGERGVYQ